MCTSPDKPVLCIRSCDDPPVYFNLCDTSKLRPGQGEFTVDADRQKVARVLRAMIKTKMEAQRSKGNFGLSRLLYIEEPRCLEGLPTPPEEEDHAKLTAVDRLKRGLGWRDDETEAAWVEATGLSLLHIAAARADLDAVNALLALPDEKAFLNRAVIDGVALDGPDASEGMGNMLCTMTANGMSPLLLALCNGTASAPTVVDALVAAGADMTATCPMGGNVIWHAACSSTENLKKCLELCPDSIDVNAICYEKMTALHLLCRWGDREGMLAKAKLLLDHGANPSLRKKDIRGGDPLCALARNPEADPDVVQLLIDAGAEPAVQETPHGALRWALRLPITRTLAARLAIKASKFMSMNEYIVERGGGGPLHQAALRGDARMMRALAQAGVPSNVRHRSTGKLPVDLLAGASPDKIVPASMTKILVSPRGGRDEQAALPRWFASSPQIAPPPIK